MKHLRAHILNWPLLCEPSYAQAMVGALAERIGVESLTLPNGQALDPQALKRQADAQGPRGGGKLFEQLGDIAVIQISGALAHKFGFLDPVSGLVGTDAIQLKLESALADPSVAGIVLDIDSPAGEVAGIFDLADQIAAATNPIWSLADELAASASYALAAAADRVVLPRTARVGSIGVLMMHVDQSKQLKDRGLAVTLIHAGKRKIDGNPFAPLPAPVRAELQEDVESIRTVFVTAVARNRGISAARVEATEAAIYSGQDAVKAGLADEVMPAHEVLQAFDSHLSGSRRNRSGRTAPRAQAAVEPLTAKTIEQVASAYWSSASQASASTRADTEAAGARYK